MPRGAKVSPYRDPSGDAKIGTIDGKCISCGSPLRRMGWLNYPGDYWLMCTASQLSGEPGRLGGCDLPTEEKARKRLARR